MADQKELQEKMLMYRMLENRLESVARERDLINQNVVEIISTLSSIDEMGKNENMLFKLGSEVYTHGSIADKNKILIEIGAGIVLEKTLEEGKVILTKRREELEKALHQAHNDITQITNMINQLAPELNEMVKNQNLG